jgi:hypothetical protein
LPAALMSPGCANACRAAPRPGRVHLEVPAERDPGVGETKAVAAERHERVRGPAGDLVGYGLDEVGDRDDRPRHPSDRVHDIRLPRGLGGMQAVPALHGERRVAGSWSRSTHPR